MQKRSISRTKFVEIKRIAAISIFYYLIINVNKELKPHPSQVSLVRKHLTNADEGKSVWSKRRKRWVFVVYVILTMPP